MRLPRWLVICMLGSSALIVLGAVGWWWITWPERTAEQFAELVTKGRWQEASEMIQPSSSASSMSSRWILQPDKTVILLLYVPDDPLSGAGWKLPAEDWQKWFCPPQVALNPRSIPDLFAGRRRFSTLDGVCVLTAERGKITVGGHYANWPLSYPVELQVHSFPGRFRE